MLSFSARIKQVIEFFKSQETKCLTLETESITIWSTSRNGSKANLEDAYREMRRKYGNRGGGTIQFTVLDN